MNNKTKAIKLLKEKGYIITPPKKTIILNGWEYTIEDEQKAKKYDNIKIPKGWQLWEGEDAIKFHKDKKLRKQFNLEDCWFFVESIYYLPEYVARFSAYSDWAYLSCDRYPSSSNGSLGVRFKRKVKK